MKQTEQKEKSKKKIGLGVSLLIFVIICAAIAIQKAVFGGNMGAMFLMLWVVLIPIGMIYGYSSHEMESAAIKFTAKAVSPMLVLLTAGALVSCWIAAGSTPAVIYYGIKLINPKIFLVASLLLCSLVSLLCGTSMGTIGTAGVALIGIGNSLGIPSPITAGAIVCGAFFGDKMSPMSDTTILASSMSEVDIFKHIRQMAYDQVPTYLFTVVFFLVIGFRYGGNIDPASTAELLEGLSSNFNLGFLAFLPIIVTAILLALKQSALLSMLSGALTGVLVAIVYQGMPVADAFNVFYGGYHLDTDSEILATLLNRGGVADMWGLVAVTLFGFTVAGMLDEMGIMNRIAEAMMAKIKKPVGIAFMTILFGIVGNAIAMSQNFTIVMTGTLMAPVYKKYNLQPKNCSRDLEAGGTYGALLIPWNVNTIFVAATLGVSTTAFIPFIPLIWLTPIVVLIFTATRFKLAKIYEDVDYVDVSERLAADPAKQAEIA